METQVVDKFTWVIKDFCSLESKFIHSDPFVVGGCKWRLQVYPEGVNNDDYLSLYLCSAPSKSLPSGWQRHAKYSFMIVNQIPQRLSKLREGQPHWFNEKSVGWGFVSMFSLKELKAKDSGYLVNGELKIVAEVVILEVVGELDIPKETSSGKESIDVNGFPVLASQVGSVRHLFDKHPDIALAFRPKNQHLRAACINVLLGLIGTLRQPLQELSNDDLVEADTSLIHLKHSGFKVDWLEKNLEEVKARKKEEQICENRVQELDKELKACKQKWSDIEAQLVKEKAKNMAARAHLTLDDFF